MKYLVILTLLKGWSGTKTFYPFDPCYYVIFMLLTPFPEMAFVTKFNANNGRNPPSCPFPFRDIEFINEDGTCYINEEAIGAINEAATGAIIAPRNPPSCFLCHVLLFQ